MLLKATAEAGGRKDSSEDVSKIALGAKGGCSSSLGSQRRAGKRYY